MVIKYFQSLKKYAIGFVEYRSFIILELFDTYEEARAELRFINGG